MTTLDRTTRISPVPGWIFSEVNSFPGIDRDVACPFTVSGGSFPLDRIEVAAILTDGANELDIWLMDDDNGVPGGIVEAFTIVGQMGDFQQINPPIVATSTGTQLNDGETYWVVLSVPDLTTWGAWNLNDTDDQGTTFVRTDLGDWERNVATRPTFRVCARSGSTCPVQAVVDDINAQVEASLTVADAPPALRQQVQLGLKAIGPDGLLDELRSFRDDVLSTTPAGQELTGSYYRYGEEMKQILAADTELSLHTLGFILHTLPAIRKARQQGGSVTLSLESYERGLQLLGDFEARASAELRAALSRVRSFLKERSRRQPHDLVEIRCGGVGSVRFARR